MMLFAAGLVTKPRPSRFASDWQCRIPNWLPWARSLMPHLDLDELVLLSSCNRVEIYKTTRRAITDGKFPFSDCSVPKRRT
jgi:hypothetical protein